MRLLILLSKIFTSLAGITNPKPKEEKKYAWMVFALLCLAGGPRFQTGFDFHTLISKVGAPSFRVHRKGGNSRFSLHGFDLRETRNHQRETVSCVGAPEPNSTVLFFCKSKIIYLTTL